MDNWIFTRILAGQYIRRYIHHGYACSTPTRTLHVQQSTDYGALMDQPAVPATKQNKPPDHNRPPPLPPLIDASTFRDGAQSGSGVRRLLGGSVTPRDDSPCQIVTNCSANNYSTCMWKSIPFVW